ncbi:hypothetical protein BDZ91DRAFT_727755 [Kalaharituber pfeilii]|nr:hypothetical protein BDZ91DRAFT_727755 [Kalaharituber pfeilii]
MGKHLSVVNWFAVFLFSNNILTQHPYHISHHQPPLPPVLHMLPSILTEERDIFADCETSEADFHTFWNNHIPLSTFSSLPVCAECEPGIQESLECT